MQLCHRRQQLGLLLCVSCSLRLPQKIETRQGGAEHGAGLPLHRPDTWQIHHQSPITLTFQSQHRPPDGRHYMTVDMHQCGFPLRRTNTPLGNSLETQRKNDPPKSRMQGHPKGIFLGVFTSMSIDDPFSFPLFHHFSLFFHSHFFFLFLLLVHLIPLCNFWEKVIADLYTARRARRLQRHYVFITIIFVLNWHLQPWNLESISQSWFNPLQYQATPTLRISLFDSTFS